MAESRGSAFWSALAGALGVSTGGRPETALLCLLPGWLRVVRCPAAAPAGAERRRSEMRAERSPPVIERRFVIKNSIRFLSSRIFPGQEYAINSI